MASELLGAVENDPTGAERTLIKKAVAVAYGGKLMRPLTYMCIYLPNMPKLGLIP